LLILPSTLSWAQIRCSEPLSPPLPEELMQDVHEFHAFCFDDCGC
jgi:hypothetical protein